MIFQSVDLDSYPVQRWARKGHMPQHIRREGKRVFFRFEVGWVAINENDEIMMKNGERMPVFKACLKSPGWVIGSKDMQAASHKEWAEEWRNVFADYRLSQIHTT